MNYRVLNAKYLENNFIMNELSTIKQLLIIFLLVICISTSMMSLMILSEGDFKDYQNLLIFSYITSTTIFFLLFYYLLNKSRPNVINDTKVILEVKINKQVWLQQVKKDYFKSIFITISIWLLVIILLFFFLKAIYNEEPFIVFALLNLFLPIFLPIIIIFGRAYRDKIVSNLFSKEYIIKFYKEGIFVNKWLFPLRFYHWRSKINIKEIKTGINFIEFITISEAFIPVKYGSGDFIKTSKLKIPIMDAKQIELLKKNYCQ